MALDQTGNPVPTGYGRACEWKEDPNRSTDSFRSFGAYQRSLKLQCQEGQPGIVTWTPDRNSPDLAYYQVILLKLCNLYVFSQCYTHRHLGWKIHIVDRCDPGLQFAASQHVVTNVTANVIPVDLKKEEATDGEFVEPNPKVEKQKDVSPPQNDVVEVISPVNRFTFTRVLCRNLQPLSSDLNVVLSGQFSEDPVPRSVDDPIPDRSSRSPGIRGSTSRPSWWRVDSDPSDGRTIRNYLRKFCETLSGNRHRLAFPLSRSSYH